MSEQRFWRQIKNALKRYHLTRVENHEAGTGIPDVDYCVEDFEGHLELKFCSSVSKGIVLRKDQYVWFRDRVTAGGRPMVLTKIQIGPIPCYFLHYGSTIVKMKAHRHTSIDYWDNHADNVWEGELDYEELICLLANPAD